MRRALECAATRCGATGLVRCTATAIAMKCTTQAIREICFCAAVVASPFRVLLNPILIESPTVVVFVVGGGTPWVS